MSCVALAISTENNVSVQKIKQTKIWSLLRIGTREIQKKPLNLLLLLVSLQLWYEMRFELQKLIPVFPYLRGLKALGFTDYFLRHVSLTCICLLKHRCLFTCFCCCGVIFIKLVSSSKIFFGKDTEVENKC